RRPPPDSRTERAFSFAGFPNAHVETRRGRSAVMGARAVCGVWHPATPTETAPAAEARNRRRFNRAGCGRIRGVGHSLSSEDGAVGGIRDFPEFIKAIKASGVLMIVDSGPYSRVRGGGMEGEMTLDGHLHPYLACRTSWTTGWSASEQSRSPPTFLF